MRIMKNLIAFAGYARCGKDTACDALVPHGYKRVAFGDLIKEQVDGLCRNELGFSAFTQDDIQKKQIRPLLEQWGEVNYDNITDEFFENLPEKAVNGRIVRLREAYKWKERGGHIVMIVRPEVAPATEWEAARLAELQEAGVIDMVIINSDLNEFKEEVVEYARQ